MVAPLLVDIGNTRIKWKQAEDTRAADYHLAALPTQLSTWWNREPSALWLAGVNPEAVDQAQAWAERHWTCPLRRVETERERDGLRIAYEQPANLGVDRWLAMLGARDIQTGALCVVDCGSAVTVDRVAADGQHLGGWILPGLPLMAWSLGQKSPVLQRLLQTAQAPSEPRQTWGRDTVGGVTMGALHAIAGAVNHCLTETDVTCLITGGDAERIAPLLARPPRAVPDLVLRGLETLARS